MPIETNFDSAFVADLALREKQIQQNYRPIIGVHKWFARRPGTLFRALVLAEFSGQPLRTAFYESHRLGGIRIADPFMGGGTPLIEANRVGCDVVGFDINPMSFWIVQRELEHLDLSAYRAAASALRSSLEAQIGPLYRTRCTRCGSADAHVKCWLWVKVQPCARCRHDVDLFPGYLIAENRRHPRNVLLCASCGDLVEVEDRKRPGSCPSCAAFLSVVGPARRGRCACHHCGEVNAFPDPSIGPPRERIFAIEYHCPACRPSHKGRFFKKPDEEDLTRAGDASARWRALAPEFVPDDEIPAGDETDRLHRWGYRRYADLFNDRQLLGLELSCREIRRQSDRAVRDALATNLSDLLRYQNMLCRYDTMALKCLDIFSVHGFPVGLVRCEANLIGVTGPTGKNIGSGGWSNIVEKYLKAKEYCQRPFEVRKTARGGTRIPVREWIGDRRADGGTTETRDVRLFCRSATEAELPPASLDAVLTDPPYFGSVQYAELMDFCYVWLRKLVGSEQPGFQSPSTRNVDELTGNATMERDLEHFAEGLSAVYRRMACALKHGSPFVFTYHHNDLEAYYPVAVAMLDAGLTCTRTLACPAEMGASIHINGTGSSVVDTVFVCRSTGSVSRRSLARTPREVAALVGEDLAFLRAGGLEASPGDIRCIVHGHLIRLAVWRLRGTWDAGTSVSKKIAAVAGDLKAFGMPADVLQYVQGAAPLNAAGQGDLFRERVRREAEYAISF